jgi:hypothetical protein
MCCDVSQVEKARRSDWKAGWRSPVQVVPSVTTGVYSSKRGGGMQEAFLVSYCLSKKKIVCLIEKKEQKM